MNLPVSANTDKFLAPPPSPSGLHYQDLRTSLSRPQALTIKTSGPHYQDLSLGPA
ncbi:uncharacterized protein METZ01_LOCUS220556, partial [marine metagenome]